MQIERKPCPNCGYKYWKRVERFKTINTNGEFVEGYGHTYLSVSNGYDYYCVSCGYLEGGNPVVIDLNGNYLRTIGE